MPAGKIIKGIAGFYYVHDGHNVWACRAAGIFRRLGLKPLVGDDVEFDITDELDFEGNVVRVLPRRNCLVRPEVANIDQALLFFASAYPEPNLGVLDRLLVSMGQCHVPCVIAFNKMDLSDRSDELRRAYRSSGYELLFLSVEKDLGVDDIRERLKHKTTVLAGPSGAGKSSLMKKLLPDASVITGEVSARIGRGRQTTRHSEIFSIDEGTYVLDTPGFTSFEVTGMAEAELSYYYPEFTEPSLSCRFPDCVHMAEPDCGVKKAVADGTISRERYHSYRDIYTALKNSRRY